MFGAREALRTAIGELATGAQNPTFIHHATTAQSGLDQAIWAALWDEGRAMSLVEAISYAIDDRQEVEPTATPASIARLSKREQDVIQLLVEGRSNQEIAAALFISPHTAANHVASIMNKLGLDSRTAVATYAIRHGLV
jgi:DNA-binding NarL/FixJ family response regulator